MFATKSNISRYIEINKIFSEKIGISCQKKFTLFNLKLTVDTLKAITLGPLQYYNKQMITLTVQGVLVGDCNIVIVQLIT